MRTKMLCLLLAVAGCGHAHEAEVVSSVEPRANIRHSRDIGQESREFEDFRFERMGAFEHFRFLVEQILKVMGDHGRARS